MSEVLKRRLDGAMRLWVDDRGSVPAVPSAISLILTEALLDPLLPSVGDRVAGAMGFATSCCPSFQAVRSPFPMPR